MRKPWADEENTYTGTNEAADIAEAERLNKIGKLSDREFAAILRNKAKSDYAARNIKSKGDDPIIEDFDYAAFEKKLRADLGIDTGKAGKNELDQYLTETSNAFNKALASNRAKQTRLDGEKAAKTAKLDGEKAAQIKPVEEYKPGKAPEKKNRDIISVFDEDTVETPKSNIDKGEKIKNERVQGPSSIASRGAYSGTKNLEEKATELGNMHEDGKLTDEQYTQALSELLQVKVNKVIKQIEKPKAPRKEPRKSEKMSVDLGMDVSEKPYTQQSQKELLTSILKLSPENSEKVINALYGHWSPENIQKLKEAQAIALKHGFGKLSAQYEKMPWRQARAQEWERRDLGEVGRATYVPLHVLKNHETYYRNLAGIMDWDDYVHLAEKWEGRVKTGDAPDHEAIMEQAILSDNPDETAKNLRDKHLKENYEDYDAMKDPRFEKYHAQWQDMGIADRLGRRKLTEAIEIAKRAAVRNKEEQRAARKAEKTAEHGGGKKDKARADLMAELQTVKAALQSGNKSPELIARATALIQQLKA